MRAAIFAYSRQGMKTARRLFDFFKNDEVEAYIPQRLSDDSFSAMPSPSGSFYGGIFAGTDAMIFISSCGIAVREISPFVHDKRTDPAVICIDELGKFVIPLLSGHIGGANELAVKLADYLEAMPIVTTATDIHHKFSVDEWAARNGLTIDNLQMAKEISAAILERDIPIFCGLPVISSYPNGTFPGESGPIGIYIGWTKMDPFNRTLRLIPHVLTLGIGCRKGITKDQIQTAVNSVFEQYHLDFRGIASAASIDLKAEEPGLIDFCKEGKIHIDFFSADILRKVQGDFSHSDFVQRITGVDNVCERAALIHADYLVVPKTAVNGVTIAVGVRMQEVSFV